MTREKIETKREMDRQIIRMTVPTVLSNIVVPLLAICDTAVAGHMPGEMHLAGVSLGSMMVTTAYWLFSFLRAGTSGITAMAFGAEDRNGMAYALARSLALGVLLGVLIFAVHDPLKNLLLHLLGASPEVTALAGRYFSIAIFGAVPMMIITSVSGWLVGMQSTAMAMLVNVSVCILNVAITLLLVYGADMGFDGIACGTMAAQWMILVPTVFIVVRLCRHHDIKFKIRFQEFINAREWKRLFDVNSNLFFRSACMIAATMILYACGARLGDVVICANAVINQLFLFFSYFMDGFAFTGEALVGRYSGARNEQSLSLAIRRLLWWTVVMTVTFVAIYGLQLHTIASLLSESAAVVASVDHCYLWAVCIPIAGAAAFIFDGFYIGLTLTRPMLLSTVAGFIAFVVVLYFGEHSQWMLWMAFTCYLAVRSAVLIKLFPRKI